MVRNMYSAMRLSIVSEREGTGLPAVHKAGQGAHPQTLPKDGRCDPAPQMLSVQYGGQLHGYTQEHPAPLMPSGESPWHNLQGSLGGCSALATEVFQQVGAQGRSHIVLVQCHDDGHAAIEQRVAVPPPGRGLPCLNQRTQPPSSTQAEAGTPVRGGAGKASGHGPVGHEGWHDADLHARGLGPASNRAGHGRGQHSHAGGFLQPVVLTRTVEHH